MKRWLCTVVAAAGVLGTFSAPAGALTIDPPDPSDPPSAAVGTYDQRWAPLVADPGFQAMMAAAGEVQSRTSLDGLRRLIEELPMKRSKAQESIEATGPGELEAARQRVLDLLVMPSAARVPDGPSSSAGAQDPMFCSTAFRGDALHPNLPGPYGEFTANAALNFCMPNGPYGNDLCSHVPDQGYVFDFRRACYQHDMAYFWTPLSSRLTVDDQFLTDMVADCTAAHAWYSLRRVACYAVAGIYYLGVRVGGALPYANRADIPGYSRPRLPGEALAVFRPFVLPGNGSTCNQYSHAWVGGVGATVTRGSIVYPTGVVAAATRIVFEFVNPATGQLVRRHVSRVAQSNCVVNHEPEAVSTATFPTGRIDVYAKFTRWEAVEDVRLMVTSFTVIAGANGGASSGGSGCPTCVIGPINPNTS